MTLTVFTGRLLALLGVVQPTGYPCYLAEHVAGIPPPCTVPEGSRIYVYIVGEHCFTSFIFLESRVQLLCIRDYVSGRWAQAYIGRDSTVRCAACTSASGAPSRGDPRLVLTVGFALPGPSGCIGGRGVIHRHRQG